MRWRRAQSCCVICYSGIGDAIMATPLVSAIKQFKPAVHLVIVCSEATAPVFQRNPHVDVILIRHSEGGRLWRDLFFLWRLRRKKIDVCFAAQPANTIKHSFIAASSGAGLRLKHEYDFSLFPERDFSFVYHALLPSSMERHRVELNLDFLRFLGEDIPERSIFPAFYVNDSTHARVEKLLRTRINGYPVQRLIAVHPGGLREDKLWPIERFAEISHTLIKEEAIICLVGGKDEVELCNAIVRAVASPYVLDFADKLTLEETAALLTHCNLLLSNDTGIMHLATAVRTKVVAILGPTDVRHIGPFTSNAKVLFRTRDIRSVSTEEVLQTILEVWDEMPEIEEPA